MKSVKELLDARSSARDQEMARRVFKQSLFHTCKYLLDMVDVNWKTHGDMINGLESLEFGKTKNALIVMPRGALKSSIGSIAFPIWRLLRNPNRRILIDSATYDLSTQLVSAIADYLESPAVTGLFGTFRTKDDWSSKSITIAQRTKILKESSVVASGVGSPKTGAHFDSIICDDLNNEKNTATPELAEKTFKHYQMNFAILDPGGDCAVIATRYSSSDICQRILDNEIGDSYMPDYLKARRVLI